MRKCLSCSVVMMLMMWGCTKPLPSLEGIDQALWKKDKNACAGKRWAMVTQIERQKDKLLALSEDDIVAVLGKPDQNELYKRNQKFFYYFVQPAPACQQDTVGAKRLAIRFNAMGLAKEVAVEN
ncbi:hypothetical protein [Chryseolinea lacunae]|uniref:Lipoprotein SmpA/OmlA domain-containing protein n=1 Tax=Chryseolinea lacunae TaxID=2801331 RepID=A0ABS1KY82_9BACT|nr:hypothetical protein [Chryseolinea lacunae]MBL0744207.1 hypothetical protein [Chryseolinea lacunae]